MSDNHKTDISVQIKADFTSMIEASPKGFKYICHLLFGKRYAEIERQTRLSNAQDLIDYQKILDGKAIYDIQNNTLKDTNQNIKEILVNSIQDEELKNLLQCSSIASQYLENKEDLENLARPSQDFVNRWRNDAKLINDQYIQNVWGKILSEEIEEPNTISLRVLDIIKNLSKIEANNFLNIIDFIFFEVLLDSRDEDNHFYTADIAYSLRDAGLIISYTPGSYRSSTWGKQNFILDGTESPNVRYLRSKDKYIFIKDNEVNTEPKFTYWELSEAGKVLYQIIKKENKTSEESLQKILKWVAKETKNAEFYHGDYQEQKNWVDNLIKVESTSS